MMSQAFLRSASVTMTLSSESNVIQLLSGAPVVWESSKARPRCVTVAFWIVFTASYGGIMSGVPLIMASAIIFGLGDSGDWPLVFQLMLLTFARYVFVPLLLTPLLGSLLRRAAGGPPLSERSRRTRREPSAVPVV